MTIDINKLKNRTKILKELIEKYKNEINEEIKCFDNLIPVFKKIETDSFYEEYDDDPCGRSFSDGILGKYNDLEDAYSNFLAAASGVDEAELDKFLESLSKK